MSTLPITSYRWPRFFSLMDTLKIQRPHEEYGRAVQAYFHSLFPHRQWSVFQDPDGTPLAVDVELLYPTVEEPFYLLHTIGMSAAPMHYPAGEFVTGKEGYGELCLILRQHLMQSGTFPHEIGIFLGYPLADVKGFIINHGHNCLCCGDWKVYSDPENAVKTFRRYCKCKQIYRKMWEQGKDLRQLTVSA